MVVVLIVGATGKTGLEVIDQFAKHPSQPVVVHAFCRDPSRLPAPYREKCASVVQGDAESEGDMQRALEETMADWIVIASGRGKGPSRQTSARRTPGSRLPSLANQSSKNASGRWWSFLASGPETRA